MLSFSPLTPQSLEQIHPYLLNTDCRFCDFTPGALVMWRDFFHTQYAIYKDSLFLKVQYQKGKAAYPQPLGGQLEDSLPVLLDSLPKDEPTQLSPISKSCLTALRSYNYPMEEKCRREWFDYLYEAAELKEYVGRKYHGQRNHVNKFTRLYPDWAFTPNTNGQKDAVLRFLKQYFADKPPQTDMAAEEQRKTYEVFETEGHYGMATGILTVGGKIVAVSAGEVVGDTLFVHIEKGETNYPGVYQVMVQAFARQYANGDVRYINREEDAGVEGLRTSKLSYQPVELLEKYSVHWNV